MDNTTVNTILEDASTALTSPFSSLYNHVMASARLYLTKKITHTTEDIIDRSLEKLSDRYTTELKLTAGDDVENAMKALFLLFPRQFLKHSVMSSTPEDAMLHRVLPAGGTFYVTLPDYMVLRVHRDETKYNLILTFFGTDDAQMKAVSAYLGERIERFDEWGYDAWRRWNLSDKAKAVNERSEWDEWDDDTSAASEVSEPVNPIIKSRSLSYREGRGLESSSYTYVSTKPLGKIYTNESTKEKLKTYLNRWSKANEFFRDLNIEHKLGILLYGPPGTGKTTMAKTISYLLDAPMYTFNMGTFPNTSDLNWEDLSRNDDNIAVVVFEDIDYYFADKVKTSEASAASGVINNDASSAARRDQKQALLQILDGAPGTNGLIFIATTNDKDALSDAMLRAGRFDLKIKMDNINEEDGGMELAKEMCSYFKLTPEMTNEVLTAQELPINPATLQANCISYIFDHLDDWMTANEASDNEGTSVSEEETSVSEEVKTLLSYAERKRKKVKPHIPLSTGKSLKKTMGFLMKMNMATGKLVTLKN